MKTIWNNQSFPNNLGNSSEKVILKYPETDTVVLKTVLIYHETIFIINIFSYEICNQKKLFPLVNINKHSI